MFKFNFNKELKDLYFCADYFSKSKLIVEKNKSDNEVIMQWFQRKNNIVLCGIEYILQFIKYLEIKCFVEYIPDGSIINDNECILKIKGRYQDFCQFEGLFDGILSRCSSIATNAHIIKSCTNKKIINMGDRADSFYNLELDGYASYVGGLTNLVTKANYGFIDKEISLNGTMPHSLIACFEGDMIKACQFYIKEFPKNDLVCLIDYNNDCIKDALLVANEFKEKLKAVRVDTSQALVDNSLKDLKIDNKNGVNPTLIKLLREELDKNGFKHVKIIVSSGFDKEKIEYFEKNKAPVDTYGVGEALFKRVTNFTGDLIWSNGKNQSKVGRTELFNKNFKKITFK